MATYTLITTCYTQLMTIAYTQLLKSALMTIAYSKSCYLTVIFNAIKSMDHILKRSIPRGYDLMKKNAWTISEKPIKPHG